MEEIKVKEYIRTKEGSIFQIKGTMKRVDHILYDTDVFGIISSTELQEMVKNHNKNIIRLIEEGDFVNGYICKRIPNFANKMCNFDLNAMQWVPLEDIDVWYDIVTHEQFNQMKYIVGDE